MSSSRQQLTCFLLASLCLFLLASVLKTTSAAALEDQLPDTTGLFFGKRGTHPNMNNLLFGRRSSEAAAHQLVLDRLREDEARQVCKAVRITCSKLALDDDDQQVQ